MTVRSPEFEELLELYGVQPTYEDVRQRRQDASMGSLLAVLQCLGAPVRRMDDVPRALQQRRHELLSRCIEPVVVAWDGEAGATQLSIPDRFRTGTITCRLETESGLVEETHELDDLARVPPRRTSSHGYVQRWLPLPKGMPRGYHRLLVDTPAGTCESQVIAAPRAAYSPEEHSPERLRKNSGNGSSTAWGCFLPTYALTGKNSWGAGDFTLLAELAEWIGELGGRAVGTLPLLAAYLDEPCEPSPYAPASRLFWNEFYVDVPSIPELQSCPAARELIRSDDFQRDLAELRQSELVEYKRLAALKRRVLELLAADFFQRRPPRIQAFRKFVERHPHLEEYARFRAAYQELRQPWSSWPQRMRGGYIGAGDFQRPLADYHLYAQWIAAEQVRAVAERGGEAGCGLYLDLPLGVRTDGYDVWRFQDLYANTATAGAPPDAVFTKGQDWGFSPLVPTANRLDGYKHMREILRHHLQFASRLRIDHIMGLHRLYWIPQGLAPHEGVYVRYRPEEAYAVLSLESHRHRCAIVGEDLGTVPPEVNELMTGHHIRRMYVVEYELDDTAQRPLKTPPRQSVASLDTHDMPPFAAWWLSEDIPVRHELGLLSAEEAEHESRRREELRQSILAWLERESVEQDAAPLTVIRALLRWLAASPAEFLSVNLENLWAETRPQNLPGTSWERPNWKRKARYGFEQFCTEREVTEALREINRLRTM